MDKNPSNKNSLEVLSSPPNKKSKVSPAVEEEKASSGPRDQLNLSPQATKEAKEAKESPATKKAMASPAVEGFFGKENHFPQPSKKAMESQAVEEEKDSSGPCDHWNLSPSATKEAKEQPATKEAKEQPATKKAEKSPVVEDASAPGDHSPPPTKKAKRDTFGPAPSAEGDASGSKRRMVKRKNASRGSSQNGPWGLRKQMHVRIIKFNGAKRVQIVRSIEKNGKLLTWKGIAMSKQIWEKLMKNADRITRALEN